jgi:hypothetical protein
MNKIIAHREKDEITIKNKRDKLLKKIKIDCYYKNQKATQ